MIDGRRDRAPKRKFWRLPEHSVPDHGNAAGANSRPAPSSPLEQRALAQTRGATQACMYLHAADTTRLVHPALCIPPIGTSRT
jgi:hypothetical protein